MLDHYVYCSQKRVHVKEILMKLNICFFWYCKRSWIVRRTIMKFGKKSANSFKKWVDTKPVYNKKYLKTKTRSYEGKIRRVTFEAIYIPSEWFFISAFQVVWQKQDPEKYADLKSLNITVITKKKRKIQKPTTLFSLTSEK